MKYKVILALAILSSPAFAITERIAARCSTSAVLGKIRPGASWIMQNESMDKLRWLDSKQKKPSKSEMAHAKETCLADETDREARKSQARLEIKNPTTPTDKKVQDLILLLDMDQ